MTGRHSNLGLVLLWLYLVAPLMGGATDARAVDLGLASTAVPAIGDSFRQAAIPSPSPSIMPDPSDIEKRRLEIEKLRQDTSREARWRPYIPLASALVAAAAGVFAVWSYLYQRRLERRIRVEENIDKALDHLLDYPEAGKSYSVRATTALRNLARWVALSDDVAGQTDRVTRAIIATVREDISFLDVHQSGFDELCLKYWPPYRLYLETHPKDQAFLLYKYQQALATLRKRDGAYFSSVRIVDGDFDVPRYTKEEDFLIFRKLVAGYEHQVRLMKDSESAARAATAFSEAIKNSALAESIFAILPVVSATEIDSAGAHRLQP